MPRVLYKYRNWEDRFQKRILTKNELYFATTNQFNDPFDASLPFSYNQEDLTDENIFKKLVTTREYRHPLESQEELEKHSRERMRAIDFKANDYWHSIYSDYKENINKKIGICSLTAKRDNLLMWAHYANSHKGFCVGIDKSILSALSAFNLILLTPVKHSNYFPKRPMFLNDKEQNEYLIEILSTKSKHWKYEEEYRLINFISPQTAIILPNEFIKEIIFGLKIKPESKEKIIRIRNKKFPKAKMFDTSIDSSKFKLNLIQID